MEALQLLFVCTGNICRSPAAEGIMQTLVQRQGLESLIHCDSAGTSGYHVGDRADERMRYHAKLRGYELLSLSRQFHPEDFEKFDLILVMDQRNLKSLIALDPKLQYRSKIHNMTDFCESFSIKEVPDPYYGGDAGFEQVLDLLEDACTGLLKHLQTQKNLKPNV